MSTVCSAGVTRFLPESLADVLDQLVEQTRKDQEGPSRGPGEVGGVIRGGAEALEEGGVRGFFQGGPQQLSFELM